MESLLIEVTNFFDQETKHKKVKIRTVQGYCYGSVYHILKGVFLNSVKAPGGFNINVEISGALSKRLRKIFDPTGSFPFSDYRRGQDITLICSPQLKFQNESIFWSYILSPEQEEELVFDMAQQPLPVAFKDFECRGWDMGYQKVPVSFSPFRSRFGVLGMNYIAENSSSSGFSPSLNVSGSSDAAKKSGIRDFVDRVKGQ